MTLALKPYQRRTGLKAGRIRAIAAEIARVAFEESFEIEQEWTDFRGKKHKKMLGRPVSFHCNAWDISAFKRLSNL
jgi:hypothetical protein